MEQFKLVPIELRQRNQWLVWRFEQYANEVKPKKVPYSIDRKRANVTNSATWSGFEEAVQAYLSSDGYFIGIGYVFSQDDPYTGCDLDQCVLGNDLTPEAWEIIRKLNSYTEWSQSGQGVHVIMEARKLGNRSRVGNFEIYDRSRFFIVTGNHVEGTPLCVEKRQNEVDELCKLKLEYSDIKRLDKEHEKGLSDDDIVRLASNAKNGSKFNRLYQGDYSQYDHDESRADLAFCSIVAFYTRHKEQIDRIFRSSGLMREKWEREDYRDRTITQALENVTEQYRGKNAPQDHWEKPVPFDEYDVPSMPVILPDWCQRYAEDFAEGVQVPVDAAVMMVLAVLSTALARKYVIRPKIDDRWMEKNNLYLTTIMRSGERKTATVKAFVGPISDFEKMECERMKPKVIRQKARRDAKEKALNQLKSDYSKKKDENQKSNLLREVEILQMELEMEEILHLPRYRVMDCTTEKLGVLMMQNNQRMAMIDAEGDVFGNFVVKYANEPDRKLLKAGHAGDDHIIDRLSRDGGMMDDPAITFGLMVQPSVIASLPKVFNDEGILGRFIFSVPTSMVGYRIVKSHKENLDLKSAYHQRMMWLLQLDCLSEELNLDLEANQLLDGFRHRVEIAQREDGELTGILEGWASKLPGNVVRVASLIHCAEHAANQYIPPSINKETIQKAIAFGEYAIKHVKAAFGLLKMNEGVEDAKYVLSHIQKQQEKTGYENLLPYRKVQQAVKKRLDSERLENALDLLENHGYLEVQKQGRKVVLVLNPHMDKNHVGKVEIIDERMSKDHDHAMPEIISVEYAPAKEEETSNVHDGKEIEDVEKSTQSNQDAGRRKGKL